jgi:AcrR family transcriptional regulator
MGKSETHRARVYDIARGFVLERGATGWSMDDLAAEAGITKRTLYRIIESKEKLVEDIIIEFIRDTQGRIAAVSDTGKDYFSVARKITAEFPPLMERMSSSSISDIFTEYPEVEKRVIARRNELTAGIIMFFDRGISAGYLKKDLTGGFVLQLFQAMVLYFIKTSAGGEFSKDITAAFEVLLAGIGAGAEHGNRKGGKK